jgi:hypothetical protein
VLEHVRPVVGEQAIRQFLDVAPALRE